MGKIRLKKYNSDTKYRSDWKVPDDTKNLVVRKTDLMSFAICLGGYRDKNITIERAIFYSSMVEMALELDKSLNFFFMRNDYNEAEASIKGSISYFMGMISAKVVAYKEYEITYLYHLDDPAIKGYKPKDGKKPDFFGINKHDTAFLIEAKGKSGGKIDPDTFEKGKEQVEFIKKVKIEDAYNQKTYELGMKRHVIGASFDEDRMLTYYDVDPEPKGEVILELNLDRAIFNYYKPVMSLLVEYKEDYPDELIDFHVRKVGNYRIGLSKDLFQILAQFEDEYREMDLGIKYNNNHFEGLYKECQTKNIELKEIYKEINEKTSLRTDGIICIND